MKKTKTTQPTESLATPNPLVARVGIIKHPEELRVSIHPESLSVVISNAQANVTLMIGIATWNVFCTAINSQLLQHGITPVDPADRLVEQ